MKEYPEQWREADIDKLRDIIQGVLEDELPECGTNRWFVHSIYFANMLDKIMQEIWMGV